MRRDRAVVARREVAWLARQGLDWPLLAEQASVAIRRVIPHERFCFHPVDPATLLLTGGFARNLDRVNGFPGIVRNEYELEDVNKWSALADSERPVGRLSEATGGRPERSRRYRELMRPQQLAWELRAALVSGGRCWGAAGFYRSDGEPDFSEEETSFLASVTADLGEGFRRALRVQTPPAEPAAPDGPGLILLDEQARPQEISALA